MPPPPAGQHCGGRRPHLHTGEWVMKLCGGRRESFIRCGVKTENAPTTTPPVPSLAVLPRATSDGGPKG
eukprot:4644082-Prymnesium_polylepis.1